MDYDMDIVMNTHQKRKDIQNLRRIFSYGRPAGTNNEVRFVNTYLMSPPMKDLGVYKDGFKYHKGDKGEGNLILWIGDKEKTKTLFSCHTDTVHRTPIMQEPYIDLDAMKFRVNSGQCLGGDDGSGIWLMLELLRAGVPGLYIFHRAEEVGGQGSSYIANTTPDLIEGMDRAIAFDRKDTWSIITHQAGGRCCSEEFSKDFGEKLGMGHKSDTGGSFTDTANYDHIIPECTNLSVGYYNAHMSSENQDIDYIRKFRDALLKVDYESLATARDPNGPPEYENKGYTGYNSGVLLKRPTETKVKKGWSKWDNDQFEKEKQEKEGKPVDDAAPTETEIARMTKKQWDRFIRKEEGIEEEEELTDAIILYDDVEELLEFLDDWEEWDDRIIDIEEESPKKPKTKEDIGIEEIEFTEREIPDEVPDELFDWDSWFAGF